MSAAVASVPWSLANTDVRPFHMTALSPRPGAAARTPAMPLPIAALSSTDRRVDAPLPATRGETAIPAQPLVARAGRASGDELTDAPPASSPVSTTSPELGSRLPGE